MWYKYICGVHVIPWGIYCIKKLLWGVNLTLSKETLFSSSLVACRGKSQWIKSITQISTTSAEVHWNLRFIIELLNYDTNVFSQSEITELGGVRNNGGESGWLWIWLLGTAIFQSYLALLNYAPTYLWGMSKFTEICFFKVSWKLRLQIDSKNGSRVKYILRAEADDVG